MSLPENFRIVRGDKINPEEVIGLYGPDDWGNTRPVEQWHDDIEASLAAVGVKNRKNELLGAGLLLGTPNIAILSELIVHPRHRGLGIGTAVTRERVRIADEIGVEYIYAYLTPVNSLSAYEELGFKPSVLTGGGLVRARKQD